MPCAKDQKIDEGEGAQSQGHSRAAGVQLYGSYSAMLACRNARLWLR